MSATRFIVVRHCEAQGNIRRVFNGITDGDITENGARQLDLLAARMAEEHFDVIYSSPLRRSVKTAQACNRAHRLPIHVLNSLIEINGGAFEGLPFADFPKCYPRESALWNDEPHAFAIEKGSLCNRCLTVCETRCCCLLPAIRARPYCWPPTAAPFAICCAGHTVGPLSG